MDESYIVGLFFARDEAALAECRRRYGAYCRAIARNILGREADAEECENDVYLAAWNAIPPAQPRSLRAFLGKIARNLALGRYERESAQKRGGGEACAVLDELERVQEAALDERDAGAGAPAPSAQRNAEQPSSEE